MSKVCELLLTVQTPDADHLCWQVQSECHNIKAKAEHGGQRLYYKCLAKFQFNSCFLWANDLQRGEANR